MYSLLCFMPIQSNMPIHLFLECPSTWIVSLALESGSQCAGLSSTPSGTATWHPTRTASLASQALRSSGGLTSQQCKTYGKSRDPFILTIFNEFSKSPPMTSAHHKRSDTTDILCSPSYIIQLHCKQSPTTRNALILRVVAGSLCEAKKGAGHCCSLNILGEGKSRSTSSFD